MKKLLKKYFESRPGRFVRNITGYKPPIFVYQYEKQYISSDLFIWRTDNNFKTIFKATDIIEKYYGIESFLCILFFDSNGLIVKKIEIDFKNGSVSQIIDSEFIGMHGFGTFCVFNFPRHATSKEINVINKCYVGYGTSGSFSMFHGNVAALMVDPSSSFEVLHGSIRPAINERKSQYKYTIQKKFDSLRQNTLYFSNPLRRKIYVKVMGVKKFIAPLGCALIDIKDCNDSGVVEIESDFIFARPTIISRLDEFIDCHHG